MGRNSYVYFPNARYDGFGAEKAYDRASRQGDIFPVNENVPPLSEPSTNPDPDADDLVVVWYKQSQASGVCWPSKPVRYDVNWPVNPKKIVIASGLGSGPLDPGVYGSLANMLIYSQTDRSEPGYNPNEEHAALYSAQGSTDRAVFALRKDLNSISDPASTYTHQDTSRPYVLLKYVDPNTQKWDFEVFQVAAQSKSYEFDATLQQIKADSTVDPYDGSFVDKTYYIDNAGQLTEQNGPLPSEAYYLDRKGYLSKFEDVAPKPQYYLDPNTNTITPSASASPYYLDQNAQLSTNKPSPAFSLDAMGVIVESDVYDRFHYPLTAGFEINPPYPVNQLTFGPCANSSTRTTKSVLRDKDQKFFAKNGGYNGASRDDVVQRYFYRLQAGFVYDLNDDGIQDVPVGTCIPWLEALDGSFDGEPVDMAYGVVWPKATPILAVGETLAEAKAGLPDIANQCVVDVLFDQPVVEGTLANASIKLIDPLKEHAESYLLPKPLDPEHDLPQALLPKRGTNNRWVFKALPSYIQNRLTYDEVTEELKLKGTFESVTGEPTILLNTLGERDLMEIGRVFLADPNNLDPASFDYDATIRAQAPNFLDALIRLRDKAKTALDDAVNVAQVNDPVNAVQNGASTLKNAQMKALTAGDANGTGYVTVAFNNDVNCPGPVTLEIIKTDCPLYTGEIKVIEPDDVFDERLTLRHNGDFGGESDSRWFQWQYLPATLSGIPGGPGTINEIWNDYFAVLQVPGTIPQDLDPNAISQFYQGAVDITVQGTGQQLLVDRWFSTRYYDQNQICAPNNLSAWTPPQLYEGWLKRVHKRLNLYDQKVGDFRETAVNTLGGTIELAGERYEGDIALSSDPNNLNQLGIIEVYQTTLNRAKDLTINQGQDNTAFNNSILFAANRLADLYMLLGNEAYADATDPTIGFSTTDAQYGTEAPAIFSFQNQVNSLLVEELALLRGVDSENIRPFYNRLIWNFTIGDGEVAYRENYNINDRNADGAIDELDAMIQYPQGHGDAWGHYLTAIKNYYDLLRHPYFTWVPQSEAILVAGTPVPVDYRDERKFSIAAAARARTGSEIVNLTYREQYTEDPEGQWQGYKDVDSSRAWGVSGWASRSGQAALFDWVVGNAILPPVSPLKPTPIQQIAVAGQTVFSLPFTEPDISNPVLVLDSVQVNGVPKTVLDYQLSYNGSTPVVTFLNALAQDDVVNFLMLVPRQGIEKIDRTTVLELREIGGHFAAIQSEVDKADVGMNPLGVAKNVVPFDIDPARIANGETHFEQIYDRAVQAMNNAIVVFDHANESSQLLRRQQDTLTDFKRNIDNTEADFNNRLIEMFGYPYADDCGPGKTYASSYCQDGPDLYHYMYVDAPQLMGEEAIGVHTFDLTFRNLDVDATGGLIETNQIVPFHVATDSRFGLIKPPSWVGIRKAPGEIQLARSDLLLARGRFEKGLVEYDNLLGQIDKQADLIQAQYGLNRNEIQILDRANGRQIDLNKAISGSRSAQLRFRRNGRIAVLVANAAAEAIPSVTGFIAGFSNGVIIDALASLRGAVTHIGAGINEIMTGRADNESLSELGFQQAKEVVSAETNIQLTALRGNFAVQQQLLQLENLVRSEATLRLEIYNLSESMQQSADRYRATLERGSRLLDDRLRFRKQTAAQIQDYRYKDMTFRVFRNDALQKYRAQFDMAARYVYLAAKAYDFETALLDFDTRAGRDFLSDIVRQRTIGEIQGGQPLTGSGLADPMKRMWQNFQVLKSQLGFNNPQEETNQFSLRRELFRIQAGTGSNVLWRQALEKYRVEDLWEVPEFRRYCRPFAPEGIPQPGLVIPFSTTVTAGLNYFEWPLGGGDSYYSASNFATKVRSVGIWFSNYNSTQLAQTPRVYLVPVGEDIMRTPSLDPRDIRSWQILDQKMPVPFPFSSTDLNNNLDWIPTVDTIFDEMFQVRRHSDFKAYHDSGFVNQSEMTFNSRLVGRSVWNTRWVLIIPGQNLLYDADEGLERFINGSEVIGGSRARTGNGVSDIKLFFLTYAYSGS